MTQHEKNSHGTLETLLKLEFPNEARTKTTLIRLAFVRVAVVVEKRRNDEDLRVWVALIVLSAFGLCRWVVFSGLLHRWTWGKFVSRGVRRNAKNLRRPNLCDPLPASRFLVRRLWPKRFATCCWHTLSDDDELLLLCRTWSVVVLI